LALFHRLPSFAAFQKAIVPSSVAAGRTTWFDRAIKLQHDSDAEEIMSQTGSVRRAPSILRGAGISFCLIGALFLIFVSAAPLGLVDPYSMPPKADVSGPQGRVKAISVADLQRDRDENLNSYLERLTNDVADGMVHYWHAGESWEQDDAAFTRPSIWDNYLLWLHPLISGYEHFYSYEFLTPSNVLARGYGFCSQVSRLVWAVLRMQGIEAEILTNENHVVAQSNGAILDADYGVFIPMTWQEIQSGDTAKIVRDYYRGFDSMHPLLTKIYTDGWTSSGVDNPIMLYMLRYEAKMNLLKWLPPILLFLIGIGLLILECVFCRRVRVAVEGIR
jgi:hypothetical protein